MGGEFHAKRYRVEPSKKIDLGDWDPNDASGFEGDEELAKESGKLDKLQEKLYAEHEKKVLIVLQGMDTAGKDGAIRRIFQGVNPSGIRVAHFREPTPEEEDHDFLWRVHSQVPGKGELVIFNRSHYESVLIERVHGLVTKDVWERRYK